MHIASTKNAFTLLLAVLSAFAPPANAVCTPPDIRIYQNSSSLTTPLATVKPIATAQTVSEFYAYSEKTRSYMGNDLPTAGDTSLVAIHQNSLTCELSLVMVHSARNEGEPYGWAKVWINAAVRNLLVEDDDENGELVYHNDEYDSQPNRLRVGYSMIEWNWRHEDSDGMAQPLTKDWAGCIKIIANFNNTLVSPIPFVPISFPWADDSIKKWQFVASGGGTTDLVMDEQLYICFPGADPENPHNQEHPWDPGNCPCYGITEYPPCDHCVDNTCHQHWLCNTWRHLWCKFGFDFEAYGRGTLPPTNETYVQECYARFINV